MVRCPMHRSVVVGNHRYLPDDGPRGHRRFCSARGIHMGKLAKRVDAHVGERIRDRRTTLGLTRDNLATALNIPNHQVQK